MVFYYYISYTLVIHLSSFFQM